MWLFAIYPVHIFMAVAFYSVHTYRYCMWLFAIYPVHTFMAVAYILCIPMWLITYCFVSMLLGCLPLIMSVYCMAVAYRSIGTLQ